MYRSWALVAGQCEAGDRAREWREQWKRTEGEGRGIIPRTPTWGSSPREQTHPRSPFKGPFGRGVLLLDTAMAAGRTDERISGFSLGHDKALNCF